MPNQIDQLDNAAHEIANALVTTHVNKTLSACHRIRRGESNTNYKLTLQDDSCLLLRIHRTNDHGKKKYQLNQLLQQHAIKKVPKVIHLEQQCSPLNTAVSLVEYASGLSWSLNSSTTHAESLYTDCVDFICALRTLSFSAPGMLAPDLSITPIQTTEARYTTPINYMLDCLNHPQLQARLTPKHIDTLATTIQRYAPLLNPLAEQPCHLVHGDFKKENLLVTVATNTPTLTAVIDWEYARADTFYGDLATLLRDVILPCNHPHLEHIASRFQYHGVTLIDEWFAACKLLDGINLLTFLTETRERDELIEKTKHTLQQTMDYLQSTL